MCCLKYEQDTYECIRKYLPKVGSIVKTPDGQGEVVENSAVKESVKVRIKIEDGEEETRMYPITDVSIISGGMEGEVTDDNIVIEKDENVTPEEINSLLEGN
jgi:cell fate regulator YaaT (PSP1 superfamily)